MTSASTSVNPAPAKPRRRWRIGLTVLLLIGGSALYLQYRSLTRRIVLPDGRILNHFHTSLAPPNQSHSLGISANTRMLRAWAELNGKPQGSFAGNTIGVDQDVPTVGLWFHFPGGWTAEDSKTKTVVLTDAQGWKHSGMWFQSLTGTSADTQIVFLTQAVPKAGGSVRMEIATREGQILGGMNVTMPPGATPHFAWTASPLPAIQTDGDLVVTLHSLRVGPVGSGGQTSPPQNENLPRAYSISPEIKVLAGGMPTEDWVIAGDDDWWNFRKHSAPLRNSIGERASLSNCSLSPVDDAWRLDLPLVRTHAAIAAANELATFQCPVPQPGLVRMPKEEHKLGTATVSVKSIAGAGASKSYFNVSRGFPITVPFLLLNDSRSRVEFSGHSPVGLQSHTTFSAVGAQDPDSNLFESGLHPVDVTLSTDSLVPTLAINVTPWKHEHLQLHVTDDQGREIAGEKVRFLDLAIWRPYQPLPVDAKFLTITASFQEPRRFEFIVVPPRGDILKQVDTRQTQSQ